MSRRKNSEDSRVFLKAIIILLVIAAVLFLVYKGGRWLETRYTAADTRGDSNQRFAYDKQIEYDGKTYRQRKGITTVLIMGIDTAADSGSGEMGNGGSADFQHLIVIDKRNEKVTHMQINPDTMTKVTVPGKPPSIRETRIRLAHSFGDGKEESCELACDAVSSLLDGIPIDLYCAVNMDSIGKINDLVGGVTVTLEDDFTSLDPAMKKGTTLTLNAQQAVYYVLGGNSADTGTDETGMKRQQDYMSKLLQKVKELQSNDQKFYKKFIDELSPYVVTNISLGRLANLAASMEYDHSELIEIEGEHIASEGCPQFAADKDSLKRLVLETFFEPLDK